MVHAPDFPHAAVADVNVHCIRPETIKSLAVGFMKGGGAEVPGMGDPVQGVYEVGVRTGLGDALEQATVQLNLLEVGWENLGLI